MKVIDLLNKIANGEEPKKIKYNGNLYEYEEYGYFNDNIGYMFDKYYPSEKVLNDEVEIIEEDNKIDYLTNEEITLYADEEPVETIVKFDNKELVNKINEIIDEVNKLKDDRK